MIDAGDEFATGHSIIEVHVDRLSELFNEMDASAFRNRDMDPDAAAFIESWSLELPRDAKPALLVHVGRSPGLATEGAALSESLHVFFKQRAAVTRTSLKRLFRVGRISLVIGLAFLGVAGLVSELVGQIPHPSTTRILLQDSLVIGGWVALWRPLEIFLYDWWPILQQARLFDRLGAMPIRLHYASDVPSDDWRQDWPAIDDAKQLRRASNTIRKTNVQ